MDQINPTSLTPEAVSQPQEPTQSTTPTSMPVSPKYPLPKLVLLLLIIFLLGMALISYSFGKNYKTQILPSPQPLNSSPMVVSTPDPTADWKTYTDETVTFKYPKEWVAEDKSLTGSGFIVDFENTGNYQFTFLKSGNYNQVTQKPYTSLDEYIGMPYTIKTLTIGGEDARQPLPRAGSENISSVIFFSKDKKSFFKLELQIGENAFQETVKDQDDSYKLFDQILSTFKFTSKAEPNDWKAYNDDIYQFQINYPENFQIKEDRKLEENYDNLGEIIDENTTLKIKAISNVDIYQNVSPETVAEREISDSGYQHDTNKMEIGVYSAALTNLSSGEKEITAGSQIIVATISHPSNNLFIEIECEGNCQQFNQILSTFKFLK